ncbi:MAG: prephenate/arogenate dehydrogenase family protein [Hyphomicrobium sp.]|uniref:prephenate/arogenate dehydrogenase family protein n=1 Tax=Hyphomicrobium sp. TaxID=82 RepID=UPI003565769E
MENAVTGARGPMFKRLALIGVGLIGSSISHAARRAGLAGEIVGSSPTPATRERAEELGLVAKMYADPADAVRGADLVILCSPVGTYEAIAKAIGPQLEKGAIVSDVGSVKAAAVRDIAPHMPEGVHFIAGHPVAGTEQSGPDAGFAELFDGRWCILTPTEDTDKNALAKLQEFWQRLGSEVEVMSPDHHDMVLAITSHVPHLIAYNIVNTAAHLERVTDKEVIKFSAGGFRDFTRIAASDPVMWRDVFLNNKEAVLEMLGRFSEDLTALQRAIRFGDGATLEKLFTDARAIRRGVIHANQDTPQPDFGRRAKGDAKGPQR